MGLTWPTWPAWVLLADLVDGLPVTYCSNVIWSFKKCLCHVLGFVLGSSQRMKPFVCMDVCVYVCVCICVHACICVCVCPSQEPFTAAFELLPLNLLFVLVVGV